MSSHLYRVFNANGVLLYIGSTIDLERRLHQHSLTARWWLCVDRITSQPFDNIADARAAELAAIDAEFPRWNVRGRSPMHPDGHATSWLDLVAMFPNDCRHGMGNAPLIRYHRKRRGISARAA